MTRFGTLLTSTVVAALVSFVPDASGQVRGVSTRADQLMPIAAALHGSVDGIVVDDTGVPVAGATVTVSAVGAMSALAVSDQAGRFHLYGLSPGAYLVRAHSTGYIASKRQYVEVRPSARAIVSVALHRSDRGKLLTAGLGSTAGGGADAQANDDHSDVAWYLRHQKRSVLKDTTDRDGVPADEKPTDTEKPSSLARSLASPARFASNLFDLPFNGQVNLFAASSFDTVQRLFSADSNSLNIASLALGGPVGGWGDWAIQGMTAQGELGTWYLSGVLKSRAPASHVYDITVSYSAQHFGTSAPTGFAGSADSGSSRAVGSFYAMDRWQMSPQVALSYGTGYARYDYLVGPGLFSPRAELAIKPSAHVRIRTSLSRHTLAPGAEEFMRPATAGMWVPSERTFDWLSNAPLTAERASNYELVVERDLGHGYAVSARTFYQEVSNQLFALFGRADESSMLPGSPYHVGTVGDVDAKGWSASLSNVGNRHVRGAITYQMTSATWMPLAEGAVALLTPLRLQTQTARVHDVTTSIETEVPRTLTRVFVLYKVDTAFAGASAAGTKPGLDARFDVQVSQPLPLLDFTSAQWQVVFAVRNVFREAAPGASTFDELLVVRPPKRLVGGLVVRF